MNPNPCRVLGQNPPGRYLSTQIPVVYLDTIPGPVLGGQGAAGWDTNQGPWFVAGPEYGTLPVLIATPTRSSVFTVFY